MDGYQKGSPNGFLIGETDINKIYAEGVSIIRESSRQWTYAIGLQETTTSRTPPIHDNLYKRTNDQQTCVLL